MLWWLEVSVVGMSGDGSSRSQKPLFLKWDILYYPHAGVYPIIKAASLYQRLACAIKLTGILAIRTLQFFLIVGNVLSFRGDIKALVLAIEHPCVLLQSHCIATRVSSSLPSLSCWLRISATLNKPFIFPPVPMRHKHKWNTVPPIRLFCDNFHYQLHI